MDNRLKPKPKGGGTFIGLRVNESMYDYLNNEARLHDSTLSETIRSILSLWYREQVPGVTGEGEEYGK